jgi:hypothetical protein
MTLEALAPLLDRGDIIIDGGNEHFAETVRREAALAASHGLHFVGMGISGGAEGARHGPSLMPGGSAHAYNALAGSPGPGNPQHGAMHWSPYPVICHSATAAWSAGGRFLSPLLPLCAARPARARLCRPSLRRRTKISESYTMHPNF